MRLQSLPMDYKQISGDRIRRARQAKGYSRPELAAMIQGLAPSTLGNWENGIRYPNEMDVFTQLSAILDEPASYLAAIDLDPELETLVRTYYKMDKRGKDTLLRVAETQPIYNSRPAKEVEQDER